MGYIGELLYVVATIGIDTVFEGIRRVYTCQCIIRRARTIQCLYVKPQLESWLVSAECRCPGVLPPAYSTNCDNRSTPPISLSIATNPYLIQIPDILKTIPARCRSRNQSQILIPIEIIRGNLTAPAPMGWWDSLWASSKSADDPLRNLDPKLREFLEKESPVKYSNSGAAQAPTPDNKPSEPTVQTPREAESSSKPAVPRESQFQDGRYADLWKTYRPLAEIEAETKSDHEKLMDVLEGYKDRKAQIGRAALENCALEQVDWRACMSNPSWSERMTLCRTQVKKFERCYMTQTVRAHSLSRNIPFPLLIRTLFHSSPP